MIICAVGGMVTSASLIPLGNDAPANPTSTEQAIADISCMAFPWLFVIGLNIQLVGMAAKIARIAMLFTNPTLKLVKVSAVRMQKYVAPILIVQIIILTLMQAFAPLKFQRTVMFSNSRGSPLQSVGLCEGTTLSYVFLVLLTGVVVLTMSRAAFLAYVVRDIPSDFQEGKWMAIIAASMTQLFLIGIPSFVGEFVFMRGGD